MKRKNDIHLKIDARCVGMLKAKVFDRVLFLPVKRA